MNAFLIVFIQIVDQALSILIIGYVLISYFMSPYHPIRQTIEKIIDPLLAPIRQILPQTGMIDFSPLVLFILVQIVSALLLNFLRG